MTYENIIRVRKGNEDACKLLIEEFSLMIYSIINSFDLSYGDYQIGIDDLFQEGCLALIDACNAYKKTANTKFSTFAFLVIKRRLNRVFYKSIKPYTEEWSFDKIECKDHFEYVTANYVLDNPINYGDYEYEKEFIKSLCFVDELDKKIVELRLKDYSYNEIAKILNISPKKVDNRLNRLRLRYKEKKKLNIKIS